MDLGQDETLDSRRLFRGLFPLRRISVALETPVPRHSAQRVTCLRLNRCNHLLLAARAVASGNRIQTDARPEALFAPTRSSMNAPARD